MFAHHLPRWTARLTRAAALVKAFALLEDPPRSAAATAHAPGAPAAVLRSATDPSSHVSHAHEARTHPHRRRLAAPARARRPGAVVARPAPCTTPVGDRRVPSSARHRSARAS
jgi:hypothetical protein